MFKDKTVLVVDDDPTQLLVLAGYFRAQGCTEIIEASAAAIALEYLNGEASEHPNVIVSDLMMPDMDGIELLRELKNLNFAGDLALISSLDQSMISNARKLGEMHGLNVIGTCRKPLNKDALDALFLAPAKPRGKTYAPTAIEVTPLEILEAMSRGEIKPHYQPKIDVRQCQITGAEALARWEDPVRGILSPAVFMPVIERHELTTELTFTLMRAVFEDIARWKKDGLSIKTSLNITAAEVSILDIPNIFAKMMRETGVEASEIVVEVTETAVLEFNADSLEVLSRLRLMGIEIAIDDFGTGFSNIQALKEFPYTELKIDQAFIRGMTNDPFSQETVRAAVTLGRQLNMRLLAEGIETPEEWEFVRSRGIDEVQGFFIAKPMPVTEFVPFCLENNGFRDLQITDDTKGNCDKNCSSCNLSIAS